jgi:hypothetical protein
MQLSPKMSKNCKIGNQPVGRKTKIKTYVTIQTPLCQIDRR